MKYLVMECAASYAVVLDEKGRFLKVANLGYEVGQTICSVTEMKDSRSASSLRRRVFTLAAAAACLLLVFLSGYQFLWAPIGTVQIQINPDVLLCVNRLNYVTGLQGLNDDGGSLIEGYSPFGKKLEQVSDELADRAIEMGFLRDGGEISLAVDSSYENWKTATAEKITTELSRHLGQSSQIKITIIIRVDTPDSSETGESGQAVIATQPPSSMANTNPQDSDDRDDDPDDPDDRDDEDDEDDSANPDTASSHETDEEEDDEEHEDEPEDEDDSEEDDEDDS